jgi:hypothetical protein
VKAGRVPTSLDAPPKVEKLPESLDRIAPDRTLDELEEISKAGFDGPIFGS